jgi:hypothetical protein
MERRGPLSESAARGHLGEITRHQTSDHANRHALVVLKLLSSHPRKCKQSLAYVTSLI